MTGVPEEVRFFANTKQLLGILRKHFEELNKNGYTTITTQKIDIGLAVFETMDKHYVIHRFIKFTHANWDQIHARNSDFFINNSSQVFSAMSKENFNILNELFTLKDAKGKPVVTEELKNLVLDFFSTMVKCSIKYIHKNRSPYSFEGQNFYENEFLLFPSLCAVDANNIPIPTIVPVNIDHHISMWKVKVDFPSVEIGTVTIK